MGREGRYNSFLDIYGGFPVPPMNMLSGSDLIGNKVGIKVDKKMYIVPIEINSANKKSSIMFLEGVRIPIEDTVMIKIANIKGIFLFFCIDHNILSLNVLFFVSMHMYNDP